MNRNSSGVSSSHRVVDVAGLEIGVVDDVFEKRNVGLDAAHAELAQRAVHALAGLCELAAPGRHLHQQRIVIRRDHRAAVRRTAVEPDAEARGRAVGGELSVIGHEVVGGILGGDAALQRVAVERHRVLRRQVHLRAVQLVSLRHLNLAAHEVDAGHHFGDRVLHLDARIDLDEDTTRRNRRRPGTRPCRRCSIRRLRASFTAASASARADRRIESTAGATSTTF